MALKEVQGEKGKQDAPRDSDAKLIRMRDFLASEAETIRHVEKALHKRFSESPEGKEAEHWNSVVKHYIDILENFAAHLIAGKKGERGIDSIITGLLHPDSEIRPPKKFIDQLRKLADDAEKMKLPEFREWKHYDALAHEIHMLPALPDIHEFLARFNDLLKRTVEYPENKAALTIKRKDPKKMGKIIELENLELAVGFWKLILSRLYRPEQEGKAREIIGSVDEGAIAKKIANKLGIKVDEFHAHFMEAFPQEREDADMTNLRAFANKVVAGGKKNAIMRALTAIGQDRYATLLMKQFGKKGAVKTDPKTVNYISAFIKKLSQPATREQIELGAKQELESIIRTMLRDMKKDLAKMRDRFGKVFRVRIKELKKAYAKNLADVEKIDKSVSNIAKTALQAATSGNNIVKKAMQLNKTRHDYYVRASDILTLMRARILFTQSIIGGIDEKTRDAEVNGLIRREPSDFAIKIIGNLVQAFQQFKEGKITLEERDKRVRKIDLFISDLSKQVDAICDHQVRTSEEIAKLSGDAEDMQLAVDIKLKEGVKEATKGARKIDKMGIKFVAQKDEITEEDIANLRRAA